MKFNRKYILFGSLYFSQFIPLGFFSESLPVYLRSLGYSLESIGSIHLMLLPWMLKFLWAPLVDKIGSKKAGHYRYWILSMQLIVFLCLVFSSFLNVSNGLLPIFAAIGLLSFFSSTQDIATDAYAVETLKKDEQGFGNGIQNSSHFLGSMIGGGLMLVLLNKLGWTMSNIVLGVIVLIPCLILVINWNKFIPDQTAEPHKKFSFDFFKRTGNVKWLLLLTLLPLGSSMSDFIFKPFLIDYGYSLEDVGILRGIIGLSAAFFGAIAGGFFIKRNNRDSLLFNIGILLSFSLLLLLIPVYFKTSIWVMGSIIIVSRFVSGFFTTILFTLIMQKCEKGKAGTDFSIQIAALTFSSHGLAAVAAGFLTPAIGYPAFYILAFAFSIIGIILYRKYYSQEKPFEVNSSVTPTAFNLVD